MKREHGFALVELLVVVAIISVLAALLLPALEQSLASARSIYCLNNQKQMGLASSFYANDHNGWLLYGRQGPNFTSQPLYQSLGMLGRYWAPTTMPGLVNVLLIDQYLPYPISTAVDTGHATEAADGGQMASIYFRLNYPYRQPIVCPDWYYNDFYSWCKEWTYGYRNADGMTNIGAPLRLRYLKYDATAPLSYRAVTKTIALAPSQYILWGDSVTLVANWLPSFYSQISYIKDGTPTYTTAYDIPNGLTQASLHLRHSGCGNACFVDGHGASLTLDACIGNNYGVRVFANSDVPNGR